MATQITRNAAYRVHRFTEPCLPFHRQATVRLHLDSRDQARRLRLTARRDPVGTRLIERGLATFQLLRHRRSEPQAFLYAFDFWS